MALVTPDGIDVGLIDTEEFEGAGEGDHEVYGVGVEAGDTVARGDARHPEQLGHELVVFSVVLVGDEAFLAGACGARRGLHVDDSVDDREAFFAYFRQRVGGDEGQAFEDM